VGFRQTDAGAALTRLLLARGRRRIAFAGAQLDPRVMQRLYGWRLALQEQGLYDPNLEWLNPAASSLSLGGAMFEQIMLQSPPVDAVFFCNDDLAQGALLAALRLGITVPERVAISGFNDLTGSDQMLPTLTTVRTPRAKIGEAAATMLAGLIRGEVQPEHLIDLGFEIVERNSTVWMSSCKDREISARIRSSAASKSARSDRTTARRSASTVSLLAMRARSRA
jgi:LacI family gluconate utilization system Gnt-I transcriptional repressor